MTVKYPFLFCCFCRLSKRDQVEGGRARLEVPRIWVLARAKKATRRYIKDRERKKRQCKQQNEDSNKSPGNQATHSNNLKTSKEKQKTFVGITPPSIAPTTARTMASKNFSMPQMLLGGCWVVAGGWWIVVSSWLLVIGS